MKNEDGKIWFGIGLDNSQLQADAQKARNVFKSIGDNVVTEGARIDNMYSKITRTVATVFTVQQAFAFAKQIAVVRGEFQQLEVAFTTLLQSKSKADVLMAQMVDLAAKTPFKLTDVATGAKQLIAYGFAADDITETLTRLGNIASGLGLPMERLTYLYGTTMTQGRLYARDLMQFTTSGIPMLQGLADLYGKSTDEINNMVTAGKIGFPEVQKVIENLTNEGGKFYNLMEEQSKTIGGKISNLGDAIDVMFNKIGQSQEGAINDILDSTKYLIEHYEDIGRVLGVLIASYGTYKAAVIAYAIAQKLAVSAGNIKAFFDLAKGIKTAKDAQIAFNLAMGANPLAKLASIFVAIVGLIWAFARNTSDATDEVAGLNKALKDAGAEFEKEAAKVEVLQNVINNGNVAYDERKKALNELKAIIPDYNAQLTTEGVLINNNTEAIKDYLVQLERQILLKAIQEEKEDAIRQRRDQKKQLAIYEKELKDAEAYNSLVARPAVTSKVGTSGMQAIAMGAGSGAAKPTAGIKHNIEQVNKELENTNKTLAELEGEFIATSNSVNKGDKTVKSFAEQLQFAALRVSTLKNELTQLKAGQGNETDFAKSIKEKQEELAQAEQSYNTLLGVDKKYLKEKETAFEKAEQTVKDMQLKNLNYFFNEEIALKRKQITDRVKLIEFDRDTTIAAIEAEKQAYLQLAVASGAKASDVDTSTYEKRKQTVTLSAKIDIDNVGVEETDKVKTQLEALKREFETFEQERTRIQAEYAAKRSKMYEEDGETLKQGFTQGNVDEANTGEQEALNNLDLEIAKREAAFNVWVNKLVGLGLKELKAALQTANAALNSGGSKLSEKEKAALRAKIVALEKQIDAQEAKSPEQRAAEKSKKQWGDTIKVMNDVQETVDNIVDSFDGLDEATKQALTAATNIAGGIIGMISGIQALAVTGAEAIKGVERASVILAIIGTAVQIITAIFNLAGAAEKRHQEALEEIARNKVAMQREYNQLLFEQNLLLKEATSVFGVDEITKAINGFAQYRDQLTKYKEELKGTMPTMNFFEHLTNDMLGSYNKRLNDYKNGIGALNDITIKTGHEKTGLFGWGKGRDIYTSISQVYPDIIDKEGKLNVERAKAIIATQTMSDENKNLLQSLIDMQENAKEAMEELNSYLEGTFGDLGGSIMDAITDGITNGTDAWKEFGKTGASVLEKLGKQIAYELFFSDKFKGLQKQLTDIYGSGKTPEQVAADARDAVAKFYNGIGSDMQNAENWLKQWQDEAEKQGLELWGNGEREASQKGFASMSQESADELNGRFTAMQGHTYGMLDILNKELKGHSENMSGIRSASNGISENMKTLTTHTAQMLKHLSGIETNTDKLHGIDDSITEMNKSVKSLRSAVDDISLKGIHLRR